jgi:hypothetical protein
MNEHEGIEFDEDFDYELDDVFAARLAEEESDRAAADDNERGVQISVRS